MLVALIYFIPVAHPFTEIQAGESIAHLKSEPIMY